MCLSVYLNLVLCKWPQVTHLVICNTDSIYVLCPVLTKLLRSALKSDCGPGHIKFKTLFFFFNFLNSNQLPCFQCFGRGNYANYVSKLWSLGQILSYTYVIKKFYKNTACQFLYQVLSIVLLYHRLFASCTCRSEPLY